MPALLSSVRSGAFTLTASTGATSGFTDSSGTFSAYGFASGSVTAAITYSDGVIGQYREVDATGADTLVELEYAPFVRAATSSSTAGADAPVLVTMAAVAPALTPAGTMGRFAAGTPRAGVRVTLVPPTGAAASVTGKCTASLSGTTNALGKVTLRVCASKSGVFKVRTAGAVPVGGFTLLVRGKPSLPPTALSAESRTVGAVSGQYGTARLAWGKPFFTGGVAVTSYRVTLTRAGAVPVVKTLPVTSATKLQMNVGGLTHAKKYTVKVQAVTKYGLSDAAVTTVAVA